MPLNLTLTLGTNTFTAEGEYTFNVEFLAVLRAWFAAQQSHDQDVAQLTALTDRLRIANDLAERVVLDHTPQGDDTHGS